MVEIINKEPHKSVVKEAICRNCGVTLAYVPADIKRDYESDYTGDKDYFNCISCPNCNKIIKVK